LIALVFDNARMIEWATVDLVVVVVVDDIVVIITDLNCGYN